MLTNNCKFFIRWGCISLIVIIHYVWLFLILLGSSHISDKESMLFADKTVTIEYHKAILESAFESMGHVVDIAFYGFPVSIIMILIIFKKIR